MVSTLSGKLLAVAANTFNDLDSENPSGAVLLTESPAAGSIADVAAHPLRAELLLLNAEEGQLLRWNLVDRSAVVTRQLGRDYKPLRMVVARDGSFVVLGCDGGHIVVLKGDSLDDLVVLRNTRQPIVR